MAEVRDLRDSVYALNVGIGTWRALLAETADPAGKERLSREIAAAEARIPLLQDSLARASAELQKIEMEFLFKGIALDPDKLMSEADREVEGASSNYVFARMTPGTAPDMVIEKPEVKFDYTFMVLPEGRFAEDNTLPDGIVYQIQLFSLSSRASVKSLKGLSPVFEESFSRVESLMPSLSSIRIADGRNSLTRFRIRSMSSPMSVHRAVAIRALRSDEVSRM